MRFEDLVQFIERDMRMSHVYQPVMLRLLLDQGGRATREEIAPPFNSSAIKPNCGILPGLLKTRRCFSGAEWRSCKR
jgi:hypothetical protein